MIQKIITITILYCSLSTLISAQPVTNGLVSEYTFNDGTANDGVGNADGMLHGPSLATDRFGNTNQCIELDGINDFMYVLNPTHNFSTTTTISIWVKLDTNAAWQNHVLFDTRPTHLSSSSIVGWIDHDNERVEFGSASGIIQYQYTILPGEWTNLIITVDPSTNQRILYINGIHQSTIVSHPSFVMPLYTGDGMFFGSRADQNPVSLFHGCMDDIRIYNRVLTNDEIQLLYKETNPDSTLSNPPIQNDFDISIFPNPTTQGVFISSIDLNQLEIHIWNMQGQLVIIKNIQNDEYIDLSYLSNGIYNIEVVNQNKIIGTKQIIKH